MAAAMSAGCRQTYPPDPAHDVDILSDGLPLKGSYYSPGKPGPAVLLIHQCNMNRHAWDSLTPDLVASGLHVLTFDQRGFGDTAGTRADTVQAVEDANSALDYLLAKAGVDARRVAVGGASCGVTYSASLATRRPQIKALVLLSGWADDKARIHISNSQSLAVFGVASEHSGGDAADIRQAVAASENPQSASRIVRGNAHGVTMFDTDPELKRTIVKWLSDRLSLE